MEEIAPREARRLTLHTQGLLKKAPFGEALRATERAIARLGYVQIDTISVVARAHHHVLATRVPRSAPGMLNTLMRTHVIFEYWFHAAAFLPLADYRYYLPAMLAMRSRQSIDTKLKHEVLTRIRAEGPLRSRDFSPGSHRSSGWWDWKPAKHVLEQLFLPGDLMITRRQGFQKVYDLTERALPGWVDTRIPDTQSWCRFIVNRVVSALGFANILEIGFLRTRARRMYPSDIQAGIERAAQELTEQEQLVEVAIGGARFFALADGLAALPLRVRPQRASVEGSPGV